MRKPTTLEESFDVKGSSARSVMERVCLAMDGVSGYTVSPVGLDRVIVVKLARGLRSRRPEQCVITTNCDPQGLRVTLIGQLDESAIVPLRAAILGESVDNVRYQTTSSFCSTVQPDASKPFQPNGWFVAAAGHAGTVQSGQERAAPVPPETPSLSTPTNGILQPEHAERAEHTVVRQPVSANPPQAAAIHQPPAAQPQPCGPLATLPDGRTFVIQRQTLIGRSPTPTANDADAALIVVADEAMSKTHLAIGPDELGGIWVLDRNSKNGTDLIGVGGRLSPLPPGERIPLVLPITLSAGDTQIRITAP